MGRNCPVCSAELSEEAEICTNCGNEEFQNEEVITSKREVWQKIEAKRQRIRELRKRIEKIDESRDYKIKKEQLPALEKRITALEEELQELEKKNRQLNEELKDFDSRGLPENTAGLKLDASTGKKFDGGSSKENPDKSNVEIETDNSPSPGSSQRSGPVKSTLSELELNRKIRQLWDKAREEIIKARRNKRDSEREMEGKIEEAEKVFTEEKESLQKKKSRFNREILKKLNYYGINKEEYEELKEEVKSKTVSEAENDLVSIKENKAESEEKLNDLEENYDPDASYGTYGVIIWIAFQFLVFLGTANYSILYRVLISLIIGSAAALLASYLIIPDAVKSSYERKKKELNEKLRRFELKEKLLIKKIDDIKEIKLNRLKEKYQRSLDKAEESYRGQLKQIKKNLEANLGRLETVISELENKFKFTALPWVDKAWKEWDTSGYIPAAVRLGDTELNLRELDLVVKREDDTLSFSEKLSSLEGNLEEPLILVTEMEIYDIESILPLIEKVAQHGKTLLIITPEAGKEVIEILAVNRLRGNFISSLITISDNKALSEIARETGAEVLTGDDISGFESNVSRSDLVRILGTADRVKVAGNQTVISGGGEGSRAGWVSGKKITRVQLKNKNGEVFHETYYESNENKEQKRKVKFKTSDGKLI